MRREAVVDRGDAGDVRVLEEGAKGGDQALRGNEGVAEGAAVDVAGGERVSGEWEWGGRGQSTRASRMGSGVRGSVSGCRGC